MAQSRLPRRLPPQSPRWLPLLLLTPGGAALAAPASAPAASAHWLMPALCYGAGLALTLALAARLTPGAWWRRPTARGALILAGGTWACGSALALAAGLTWPARDANPAAQAAAPTPPLAHLHRHPDPGVAPQAGRPGTEPAAPPFRAHRSLNLRSGAGVGAARLAVIPAGAPLTPTGQRMGDWWQVRAGGQGDGKELTGWVSSLWLRRQAEPANPR